ncbi:hypothetical protein [Psychrobacter sp. 16-MNA-CIBAN-0192]|uniref:hypothetical protein n=1 Tax=Psychrobacter sp. 16-MNA-CIBAN-0192 TaxID=3140448 RepID=UPI0033295730
MSNRNELDPNKAAPLSEAPINPQQVSIKAWSQKLLVALLCGASFYGGYKSYESRMVNQCFANGGQIIEAEKTLLCKVS